MAIYFNLDNRQENIFPIFHLSKSKQMSLEEEELPMMIFSLKKYNEKYAIFRINFTLQLLLI